MALNFNEAAGGAKKSSITSFSYRDGENEVRLIGDVLARYVYWLEGKNGKNIPFECLSFDRNEERFNNKEKDWVREYHPDLKCGWSYAMQCLDQGQVKIINLKKKLFEAILQAAQDGLGDPTDPETGWDVKFKRVKTGPLPYNVEYQLQVLKCKQRTLSEEEMAAISDLKSMDDVMPRPTPDAQKSLLDEIRVETSGDMDEELEAEFKMS
tara:strand:- start:963 stop:1592 length:630 start_codon:yes stop_codon:yes gene_type:complete